MRQRPIFPGGCPPSIFGEKSLYDRVRDGNGWYPFSWSPQKLLCIQLSISCTLEVAQNIKNQYGVMKIISFSGKALVRLVTLGCICCQTSTCVLSTLWSATGLTSLCYERSHLVVGFALICFQRLSTWNTATGRLPLAG